uniref:C2H2-type domain-containing protein n=1 Tax=Gopherus evgoodei TaxID=1825980 RepID=A0A8C4VRL5_9SAUR
YSSSPPCTLIWSDSTLCTGFPIPKPELIVQLEQEEQWVPDLQACEERRLLRCPHTGAERGNENVEGNHHQEIPGEVQPQGTFVGGAEGKCFSSKSAQKSLKKSYTGERPHKCLDCGKSFIRQSALVRHKVVHTGERPHKCLDCGKNFIRRSEFVYHQAIHTGERPHKCLDCGKSFVRRSQLVQHQAIHTGERPHKCLDCGKSFIRQSALFRHKVVHAGGRTHKC